MQSRKDYFKHHPSIDKMYFTADGLAFLEESQAKSHANSIADKKVDTVTREEAMAEKDGKDDPKSEEKKAADQKVKDAGKAVKTAEKTVGQKQSAVDGKTKGVEAAKPEKKEAAEAALKQAKAELVEAEGALTAAKADLETATNERAALDEPAA